MKTIQEVLDAVFRETEKVISEIGVPVACSAGCSACCKQPIPISFAEARHAMESYRERYGAKALKRLVKKARKDLPVTRSS